MPVFDPKWIQNSATKASAKIPELNSARTTSHRGGFCEDPEKMQASILPARNAAMRTMPRGRSIYSARSGSPVCTENPVRVDDAAESPKLAE
jgi:hypothetical protein